MRHSKISSLLALAATLLLSQVAFAQPTPTTNASPARRAPPGALDASTGLTAASSRSPLGMVAPTPSQVRDYVNSVSALHVAANFTADRDQALGPMSLKNGSTIKL